MLSFRRRGKHIIVRIIPNRVQRGTLTLSQTQSRKQRILGDVKKKRRQRAMISIVLAVALIAIIVGAIFLLPRSTNPVQLPDYLSHCVYGGLVYHSHPNLTVTINGANIPIPPNTFLQSCPQPIHTHAGEIGILHIETDQDRDYTVGDWFLLWGNYVANLNYTIFNSNQIFNYKTDASHHLNMTVNGTPNLALQNYKFLRNAGTSSDCAVQGGGCVPDNVVITYG
jgi:hypothetical protein